MSFPGIGRSIVRYMLDQASGTAFSLSRPHRSMSLRPAIPQRVALLHCSLPLHQLSVMVNQVAGNRQPPLSRGWGIFNRRNGEFSSGVDKNGELAIVIVQNWSFSCLYAIEAHSKRPDGSGRPSNPSHIKAPDALCNERGDGGQPTRGG
jgi:hypothetical protein